MVGEEGEVAPAEHAGSKVTHDRFGLYMQISHHLVGAPAADELNAIGIHICTQKGHGARCPEGAGGNVFGEEPVGGA